MGAAGAVNVLHRKDIAEAADPEALRRKLADEYQATFASPWIAAQRGVVDDVIEPAETRVYLASALEVLRAKREIRPQKKHGLIPL
jgi:acetyl-CoA carboxylase carboxyltransferase component